MRSRNTDRAWLRGTMLGGGLTLLLLAGTACEGDGPLENGAEEVGDAVGDAADEVGDAVDDIGD